MAEMEILNFYWFGLSETVQFTDWSAGQPLIEPRAFWAVAKGNFLKHHDRFYVTRDPDRHSSQLMKAYYGNWTLPLITIKEEGSNTAGMPYGNTIDFYDVRVDGRTTASTNSNTIEVLTLKYKRVQTFYVGVTGVKASK